MTTSIDFDSIYELHYNRLLTIAMCITKNKATAEDVVHEAFVRVFKNIDQLKDYDKLKSWLNRIVVNCANDYFRKNSKYVFTELIDYVDGIILSGDIDNNPLDIVEKDELCQLIFETINTLSLRERQVLILRYYEDYSFEEVSKTLEININTAKTLVQRGQKKLSRKLYTYVNNSDRRGAV